MAAERRAWANGSAPILVPLKMITNSWLRITAWAAGLVAAAGLLLIVQMLYQPFLRPVLQVLLPFSVGVALALLLDPTIERLRRRGLSRGAATWLVLLLFLLVVAVLIVILIPVLVKQAGELSSNWGTYTRSVEEYTSDFVSKHQGLLRRFHLPTTVQEISTKLSDQVRRAAAVSLASVAALLAGLLSKAIWLVLIPIVTVFVLADIDRVKAKALLLVPERHRERTAQLANSVGHVFGAYIRGLLTVAVLYGIACGIAIAAWRLPYAVILGAAAGALSLVPYVGTITTILLVALVALVSSPGDPSRALWVALTILIVNQAFDNGVSPKIVGKAVGLHPALAILALLVGASLFGIVGMILAVPTAASIQLIILEFYPPLKGPEPPQKRKRSLYARLLRRRTKQEDEPQDTDSVG